MTAVARAGRTGWTSVTAGFSLRGLSVACTARATVLVDSSPDPSGGPGGAALSLRVLAGIERPKSGKVEVFGVDPARDAALRTRIALLGDPVLLSGGLPLAPLVEALATVRGVPVPRIDDTLDPVRRLRALADALAAPARAELVLVSLPERYVDEGDRDRLVSALRDAIERGAKVVVATRALDDLLAFLPEDTQAFVLSQGMALAGGPAHALPWAIPLDGVATRLVRIVVGDGPTQDEAGVPLPVRASAAARLAADLLSDPEVAPVIALVEPVDAHELRVQARDPRILARAIGKRAAAGLPVRDFAVHGASAQLLAGVFGGWR